MCSFTTNSLDSLVSHVCKLHKAHPRFHVYCRSCLRSYTKWDSYRKHIQRGCKTVLAEHPEEEPSSPTRVAYLVEDMEVCLSPNEQSMRTAESEAVPSQQWHEAAYILQIKEQYYLSQVAVEQVVSSTCVLFEGLLAKLFEQLQSGLPSDSLELVRKETDQLKSNLFKGLSTEYLQRKFFKESFNLVVSDIFCLYSRTICNELADQRPSV